MDHDKPSPANFAGRRKPEPYKKPAMTDQQVDEDARRTLKRGQQQLKNNPRSEKVSVNYDHPCSPEDFDRILTKMHDLSIKYYMNIRYVFGKSIWVGRDASWHTKWANS